jgi:hypothetical protein
MIVLSQISSAYLSKKDIKIFATTAAHLLALERGKPMNPSFVEI